MKTATLPTALKRQTPWRLVAFVGIVLGMGGLVQLQPSLADSYGVLAALCAALGVASLILIEWLPSLRWGNGPWPVRLQWPVRHQRRAPLASTPPHPERWDFGTSFRFVLDNLEHSARFENPKEIQRLADEIGQAWNDCFVEHRDIVDRALRPRGRAPLRIVLWESDPIVGALLGSAFEEVGYRVLRMPTSNLKGPTEKLPSSPSQGPGRGFFIQCRRDLPLGRAASGFDTTLQELVPVEEIPSSRLLLDDALTPRQLELVSASLGHFFEKTLEVAQAEKLDRPRR